MLSQVRGALKGIVAWIFVILLILAFAMFGVPEMRQFAGNSALTVGNENFSGQFVLNEFNRSIQTQRAQSGSSYTREDAIASGLHDQVVNAIATSSAISQFAGDMGLALPREILRDYIKEIEGFQNPATGEVDRLALQGALARIGISVEEFERRIDEELMRNQILGALAAAGPAPDALVEAFVLRETENRRIAYLNVTNDMAGVAAEPTPDDLQSYYDANHAAFTAPEYRTFDLLVLRSDDFREGLEAPEEELRRIYEVNKPRLYDKPETRTLYQTTFDTNTEAQAAVAALRQGKPFENIATESGFSLEAVTLADKQKRDIVDPAVADAAFAEGLEEGAILDPVESLFGWAVIQIAGITAPETTSFEEVREELETSYLETDTRRRLQDAIDALEDERDSGADLAIAAEVIGRTVENIGPVDRFSFAPGGAIIDKVPGEALVEAFQLDEGDESEALALAVTDGYFFVSMGEITPPALEPFADVRDEVEQRWRKDEREQRISATVRTIREAVEAGQSLGEAAEPYARAPIELTIDRRLENETISTAFNEQLFFAELGDLVSGPTPLGEAQVVAEIREVILAPRAATAEQQSIYRQYLGYQLDRELMDAFVASLRDDYGVKTNRTQLDALFTDS